MRQSVAMKSLAVLDRLEQKILPDALGAADPCQCLQRFVAGYARLVFDEPEVIATFEEDLEDGEFAPLLAERRQMVIDFLGDTITRAWAGLGQPLGIRGEGAARCLLEVVHSGVASHLREGRLSAEEAVAQITQRSFHGLGSRLEQEAHRPAGRTLRPAPSRRPTAGAGY